MIKNVTAFSLNMLQEANRTARRTAKFSVIVGSALTVLSTADLILWACVGWSVLETTELILFLGLFNVFLGGMVFRNMRRSYKAYDGDGKVNEYEFTEESMKIHSTRGEETLADIKHRYDELVKLKETDNYLLLFLNDITFYPVDKRNLLPEELETIRGYVQAGLEMRKQRIKSKNNLSQSN